MDLDCIIIGGGPAGLTAATYLRRLHRQVVVFDDGRSRARWIPESHNCPGFPLGVSGTELLRRLREQAATYGANVRHSRVTTLREVAGSWEVEADGVTCAAPTVLLATGVVDTLPTLTSGDAEEALRNGLLRSCALCDGFEATDHRLAVVGPLVRATANARYLRTFSADVTVVPIGEPEDPSPGADTEGLEVLPTLHSLACKDTAWELTDSEGRMHRFDFIYAAMGAPARGELAKQVGALLNEEGAVVTNDHMETSCPGLYAIGDVVTDLNQIAVAFGHAAIASSAIHRALPPAPRHTRKPEDHPRNAEA
jgi:thioredoxin reductase (NADPH)